MEGYFFVLLAVGLFAVASCGNDAKKIECIHGKYQNDMGPGYATCHGRSGALPIPRIKQCYTEVMKTAQVVVTVGGKLKVDGAKFAQYATAHSTTNIGKAMGNCSRKSDAQEMYKKASATTQCVFQEVKRDSEAVVNRGTRANAVGDEIQAIHFYSLISTFISELLKFSHPAAFIKTCK